MSARKGQDVARLVRGLQVDAAAAALDASPRKSARIIAKTLRSAVANAENNNELDRAGLHVKEAVVTDGPILRRYRPRARGMASPIRRRLSHVRVVVTDGEEK
jgi:large subunit ribosomal protein L22